MKIFSFLFILLSFSIQAQIIGIEKIINKADSLIKIKKIGEGQNLLKTALKDDSNNIEILNRLLAIELYHTEDLNASVIYLKKICNADPSSDCYSTLGRFFDEINHVDSAIYFNQKAIELDSTNFSAILNIGVIYKNKLKDNNNALVYYMKAYNLMQSHNYIDFEIQYKEDDFGTILYNIGNTLYSFGKYEESNQYFQEGLKYQDFAILMNNGIANNYMRLSDFQKAMKFYDAALLIDENYLYSINGKGIALFKLGKLKEACQYWKKAIDSGYIYKDEWLQECDIVDPKILIKNNCNN